MLHYLKQNKLLLLIITFSIIGLLIRLIHLWKFSTFFTYDQARDLLDLRSMILQNKISLIGSTTSLHGVFSAPYWYWMALPIYLITNANPLSTEFLMMFLVLITPITIFFLLKDKLLALILSLITIFGYSFFINSMVALNANAMVFLTPLILVFLTKFLFTNKNQYLFLTLILTGFTFSLEMFVAIFFLPLIFVSTLMLQRTKILVKLMIFVITLIIIFLPQLIFDLKHNFIQSSTIIHLITGQGNSLILTNSTIQSRFFERLNLFNNNFTFTAFNQSVIAIIYIFLDLWLLIKSIKIKQKKEIHILTILMVITLLFIFAGFVIYPFFLWPWYFPTVDALIYMFYGLSFYSLSFLFKRKYASIIFLSAFLFLNINKYKPGVMVQEDMTNQSNLRTRIEIIDLVYNDINGNGFNLYTFAPNVYDYPYQYLIWWRAREKYKYLPKEYVYLPNQPAYVPAKLIADRKLQSKNPQCDYLIIEPFESQEDLYLKWRNNFPQALKSWKIGATRIEKLCH